MQGKGQFGMKDTLTKEVGKNLSSGEKLIPNLNIKVFDKDGNIKDERDVKNTSTNAGFAVVAGLLVSDVSVTAFDYIALGTGTSTITAGDTDLGGEITDGGGERRGGGDLTGSRTTTSQTNDTAQLVTTFTFTGSYAVTESGVFNASSAGDMLCGVTFSALNVGDGDSIQMTWKVQIASA